jgi:hypothetical protein
VPLQGDSIHGGIVGWVKRSATQHCTGGASHVGSREELDPTYVTSTSRIELPWVPLVRHTLYTGYTGRHFGRHRGCKSWAAPTFVALAISGALVPCPAAAQQGVRVFSLDVSEAPAIQAPKPPKAEKSSWRTSFGSQRETREVPKGPVPGLDADVVLLQGVTNLRAVQRAFPGRTWKLVVSRQMVLTDDPVDPRSYEAVSNEPATAVAVRYQVGLRIAGQEHFLAHAQNSSTAESTTATALDGEPGADGNRPITGTPRLSAGTAVRLNIGGRFLWVASVAFGDACADNSKPCTQRDHLDTWRQSKLAAGEAVVTGGLRQLPAATGNGVCGQQSVKVSPARKDAPSPLELALPREGLGCTALATAGGQASPTATTPP